MAAQVPGRAGPEFLGLIIAKAVHGQLAAGVPATDIVRQAALFGARNRDGWGVGLTILTALGNILPALPDEEVYLALFHGGRRVAADCAGQAPRRERAALASNPELPMLKRWLQNWTLVRHRDAAERTLLTAIEAGASPATLAELLLAAGTKRAFADGGHLLDFISKAFECLDLIGFDNAAEMLPSLMPVLVTGEGAEEATSWRSPVDLIALREESANRLAALSVHGAGRSWPDHAALAEALLADDAAMITGALEAASRAGASPPTSAARSLMRPRFVWRGSATPTSTAIGKAPTTSLPTPTPSTNC